MLRPISFVHDIRLRPLQMAQGTRQKYVEYFKWQQADYQTNEAWKTRCYEVAAKVVTVVAQLVVVGLMVVNMYVSGLSPWAYIGIIFGSSIVFSIANYGLANSIQRRLEVQRMTTLSVQMLALPGEVAPCGEGDLPREDLRLWWHNYSERQVAVPHSIVDVKRRCDALGIDFSVPVRCRAVQPPIAWEGIASEVQWLATHKVQLAILDENVTQRAKLDKAFDTYQHREQVLMQQLNFAPSACFESSAEGKALAQAALHEALLEVCVTSDPNDLDVRRYQNPKGSEEEKKQALEVLQRRVLSCPKGAFEAIFASEEFLEKQYAQQLHPIDQPIPEALQQIVKEYDREIQHAYIHRLIAEKLQQRWIEYRREPERNVQEVDWAFRAQIDSWNAYTTLYQRYCHLYKQCNYLANEAGFPSDAVGKLYEGFEFRELNLQLIKITDGIAHLESKPQQEVLSRRWLEAHRIAVQNQLKALGKLPVTQQQWEQIVAAIPIDREAVRRVVPDDAVATWQASPSRVMAVLKSLPEEHIPLRALETVVQALAPQAPLYAEDLKRVMAQPHDEIPAYVKSLGHEARVQEKTALDRVMTDIMYEKRTGWAKWRHALAHSPRAPFKIHRDQNGRKIQTLNDLDRQLEQTDRAMFRTQMAMKLVPAIVLPAIAISMIFLTHGWGQCGLIAGMDAVVLVEYLMGRRLKALDKELARLRVESHLYQTRVWRPILGQEENSLFSRRIAELDFRPVADPEHFEKLSLDRIAELNLDGLTRTASRLVMEQPLEDPATWSRAHHHHTPWTRKSLSQDEMTEIVENVKMAGWMDELAQITSEHPIDRGALKRHTR